MTKNSIQPKTQVASPVSVLPRAQGSANIGLTFIAQGIKSAEQAPDRMVATIPYSIRRFGQADLAEVVRPLAVCL